MEHAIAVLLAQQPEALAGELDRTAPLPAVPATLPVGLPSDLLRRRPDVRAGRTQLAAATREIGVAVAEPLSEVQPDRRRFVHQQPL